MGPGLVHAYSDSKPDTRQTWSIWVNADVAYEVLIRIFEAICVRQRLNEISCQHPTDQGLVDYTDGDFLLDSYSNSKVEYSYGKKFVAMLTEGFIGSSSVISFHVHTDAARYWYLLVPDRLQYSSNWFPTL
jgi:hypothetical protein